MSFLAQKIEKNEKITFVAKNTFTIMESHLMFANIINILFYILYKKNILENFNSQSIKNKLTVYESYQSKLLEKRKKTGK